MLLAGRNNHATGAVKTGFVGRLRINPTEYLAWLLKIIDDYSSQRMHELLPQDYLATRARLEAVVA